MKLYNVLKGEFLKNKGTGALTLCVLFTIAIHCIPFAILWYGNSYYSKNGYNPWATWINFAFYPFFLPLFLALMVHLCMSIEYKFNGLRQLYTFPIASSYFYISKFVVICAYLLVVMMLSYSLTKVGCRVLKYITPDFMFEKYDFQYTLHWYYLKLYMYGIAIVSTQLFFSRLFSNFTIPVTIASFFTISGILFSSSKYIYYNPYAYMQTTGIADVQKQNELLCLSVFISLLMLGCGVVFHNCKKTTLI